MRDTSMSIQHFLPTAVFDGRQLHYGVSITIADGRVQHIGGQETRAEKLDGILVPGFVDLQVNGGGGVLFNDEPSVNALKIIARAHAQFGTTAMLPTVISDRLDVMQRAANAIGEARAQKLPGIIGVHFEGPHLSEIKRGVHAAEQLREMDQQELAIYQNEALGHRLLTVAPEKVSAARLRQLHATSVVISLGHSNASAAQTMQALDAGASGFTHLFNAMSGITAREPGVIGAALLHQGSYAAVIADGVHVADENLQLAFRCKGAERLMLVTDAMPPVGCADGEFLLYGQPVTREGMVLRDQSGALAGSVLDMASAVRHMVERIGVRPEQAWRMASAIPAEFIGAGHYLGYLRPGYQADMVLLDDKQQVRQTWINGEAVFCGI
ncbi:N-acetylglucosamine 6-phosphate deacetylase [Permianibacter aggregans]|uniref:N-acetylglucosamine 6-phosphate deacetylase n=2 Tax=Permianibacter aggregans TaxID=1510150 RepID=A0A4R6UKH1_9GAMM|nr:N-acetylglucosamine 6-phosphate deacetylase [Permianibacter aggregans]